MAGWLKNRTLVWKITVVCVLTLVLPMGVMTAVLIAQVNRTLADSQYKASQDYLRVIADGVNEKAVAIEEYSAYLGSMESLLAYLRRDFNINAENVLDLNNTVYPSVVLTQELHKDIIRSVTIYTGNGTHPETGRIFQNFSNITDEVILDFIVSDKKVSWLYDVEDPSGRFAYPADEYVGKVRVYLRKVYSISGKQIGLIMLSTTDALLLSPYITSGEYQILSAPGQAKNWVYQDIRRLNLSVGMRVLHEPQNGALLLNALGIIGVMLLGLGLTAVLVNRLVSRLFRRFKLTLEAMQEVSRGRFAARIQEDRKDEIGVMNSQFNNLLGILEATVEESLLRERGQRDAQLEALQYQINPHFIYNSMYFLQLSMEKENLWQMADAVSWLASILHYNLEGAMFATFREEIGNLRTYLQFVNAFREKPIALAVECPAELHDRTFLRFIFQPLVENAIKYGGKSLSVIRVRIGEAERVCCVEVQNDGEPPSDATMRDVNAQMQRAYAVSDGGKKQIGLYNIASRLRLFYQEEASITLYGGEWTGVRIFFPVAEMTKPTV